MNKTARLDHEIAEALARPRSAMNAKQPLYGHTSEATAYLVPDYPYGFHERTQIRYWLEAKPKKGWRFVSQTLNPKTKLWNKPKASTYADWGGAMYLDDNGHVQWEGVGPYTNEQKILAFVEAFPGANMHALRKAVTAKLRYLQRLLSGEAFWTVNGVRQPLTEEDALILKREMTNWEEIGELAPVAFAAKMAHAKMAHAKVLSARKRKR